MTQIAPLPSPDLFARPSLWATFCDAVERDITSEATAAQAAMLRKSENLIPWLRVLAYYRANVEEHMASAKQYLLAQEPPEGASRAAQAQYAALKVEAHLRHAGRLRFARSVGKRLDECRFTIDQQGLDPVGTVGNAALVMARIAESLERDDSDRALSIAKGYLAGVRVQPVR